MSRTTATVLLAVATAAAALCFFHGAAADTVADSCDAIRDFVDASFCASRLGSVPGAATADRHAHLLMAADLAAASGGSARDAAAAMSQGATAPDALEACGLLYGGSSVPALRLMRGYAAARAWAAARALLPLTGQAGIGCDAALAGEGEGEGSVTTDDRARMAAANREFDQLSTMATALLNKLA